MRRSVRVFDPNFYLKLVNPFLSVKTMPRLGARHLQQREYVDELKSHQTVA